MAASVDVHRAAAAIFKPFADQRAIFVVQIALPHRPAPGIFRVGHDAPRRVITDKRRPHHRTHFAGVSQSLPTEIPCCAMRSTKASPPVRRYMRARALVMTTFKFLQPGLGSFPKSASASITSAV